MWAEASILIALLISIVLAIPNVHSALRKWRELGGRRKYRQDKPNQVRKQEHSSVNRFLSVSEAGCNEAQIQKIESWVPADKWKDIKVCFNNDKVIVVSARARAIDKKQYILLPVFLE